MNIADEMLCFATSKLWANTCRGQLISVIFAA